jgi:phosphoribosylanthranilate isomerase
MGADYLGIPLDGDLTLENVKELLDWVEGPMFVGELNGVVEVPNLEEIIKYLGLTKISVGPFYPGAIPSNVDLIKQEQLSNTLVTEHEVLLRIEGTIKELSKENKNRLKEIIDSNRVWVMVQDATTELLSILSTYNPYGIVLLGGEEEKVGFKSFDDIDEIFDLLEE